MPYERVLSGPEGRLLYGTEFSDDDVFFLGIGDDVFFLRIGDDVFFLGIGEFFLDRNATRAPNQSAHVLHEKD